MAGAMASSLRLLVLFHRLNTRTARPGQAGLGIISYSQCVHVLLSPARDEPQLTLGVPRAQLATASPENVQSRSVFIQFKRPLVSSLLALARRQRPTRC
jgi:hypothetical protein